MVTALTVADQTHQTIQSVTTSDSLSATSTMQSLAYKYKVDVALAQRIMTCESRVYSRAINLNKDGTRDWGYWQINDYWWHDTLLKKGWDIHKPEDNLEAGFYILSKYGTKPWTASQKCWS